MESKLRLTAYTDDRYSKVHKPALELPLSPAKIKISKGIRYAEDPHLGSLNGVNAFVRYKPESLAFDILLDMTNPMESNDENMPVRAVVEEIEARLYDYNVEGHRPSFVKAEYGDIVFFGQLKSLDTVYSIFDSEGVPFRAELKIELVGYCSPEEEKKHFSKRSPDVSRIAVLEDGQTLAALCEEVYGDWQLVSQVARFNHLPGYRDVPAGTKILLPMLKR